MANTRLVRDKKLQQIEKLKASIEELEIKEGRKLYLLLNKTGLFDVDYSEDDLVKNIETFVNKYNPQ